MSDPHVDGPADGEEAEHMGAVDADPKAHTATEPDEGDVLRRLYGDADVDGIYRGERADREED